MRYLTLTTARRLASDKRGVAAIEFALLAPLLFSVVFSIMEAGWIMSQSIMLDRGVSKGIRNIQLGHQISYQDLKTNICQEAFILLDCDNAIRLEFTPITTIADFPTTSTSCVDRRVMIDPVTTYAQGARSQIMFARACFVVDPIVPGIGFALSFPKDETGGIRLTSSFAFVNEPG